MKKKTNINSANSLLNDEALKINSGRKNNFLDMIDKLPKPNLDANANLKELYYKEKAKKYGF